MLNRFSLALVLAVTALLAIVLAGPTAYGAYQSVSPISPPPHAGFHFSPVSPVFPSVYDQITFTNDSYDPFYSPLAYAWDFKDGTSSKELNPTHQYANDGTYPVQLTVTTNDPSRATASAQQSVVVITHDVAVASISPPSVAVVGQTKTILVAIQNVRYAETVKVELWKSLDGTNFSLATSKTVSVPKLVTGTTPVPMDYTFTTEDGNAGKVTFRAVAVLTVRDAKLSDNLLTSSQVVKVLRRMAILPLIRR